MVTVASPDRLKKPTAVDKISSGDLYVLDSSGAVFRLAPSGTSLAVKSSFNLPSFSYPTDLVSARLFTKLTLLITTNNQNFGFVSQYSPDGKLEYTWTFRNGVAGLDVDYDSHIVYVASSNSPEIYQINLQPSTQTSPTFTGSVLGARQLGPLVMDMGKKLLFVADLISGQIFEFNIKTRKSRILANNLSSPQGLLLSADSTLLYIADGPRRKIYVMDLKRGKAIPQVFTAVPEFRNPSGLARLADGRLVVADDEAGSLFLLSKTGMLQSTFKQ
jgi:hypothetical protein